MEIPIKNDLGPDIYHRLSSHPNCSVDKAFKNNVYLHKYVDKLFINLNEI